MIAFLLAQIGKIKSEISASNSKIKYGLLNSGSHDANNFEHLSAYLCYTANVINIPSNLCHVFTVRTRNGFSNNTSYAFQICISYDASAVKVRTYTDEGWTEWKDA